VGENNPYKQKYDKPVYKQFINPVKSEGEKDVYQCEEPPTDELE
jgi:hypothetical protein